MTVEITALDHLIQQIYSVGLGMAPPTESWVEDHHQAVVTERLDEVLRFVYSMVLRSRTAPADLHSILERITTAAHELAELAETMNDSARMLVDEATQSLHHALIALGEADEYGKLTR